MSTLANIRPFLGRKSPKLKRRIIVERKRRRMIAAPDGRLLTAKRTLRTTIDVRATAA